MSELTANGVATVSFGERLANSQAFSDLFRDGMALVEETASYLDGPGRQESKKLDRNAALAYATESMRLTTRLMQLASWLLLHRAVKEGEMSLAQANKEKAKVKLTAADNDDNNYKVLPERLRHLIDRSRHLQSAIRRLDATMHARPDPARIRPTTIRSNASSACSRPRSSGSELIQHIGDVAKAKAPLARGFASSAQAERYFLRPRPANFFWKRDSRPPRSSSCCWPPVQAGCDFGSMSRCSVSPSLPQVVRVVNSVPSVITTLMV